MSALKKFWIVFLSFLPLSAGAVAPFIVGGIAGAVGIVGFSVYRNAVPFDMSDALSFFSTCWSCDMFSGVMATMSDLLPKAYSALGTVIIPFVVILSCVWFGWKIFSGFINAKIDQPWSITSDFGVHLIKLGLVCAVLVMPLPRMISSIVIQPIFTVGLSVNHIAANIGGDGNFTECVVATAMADPAISTSASADAGAFSPMLRYNLACEVGNVHQITGLGMTIGWAMLNMAFDSEYMHKIMWGIPIFPNVPIFFAGLTILVLFIMALLPIPVYFLEIFITLAMDLIMLPLMLMGWLFSGWQIFPQGGRTIKQMIDDVIKGTVGIAMTGVFLTFAIMFLNAVFGKWGGASRLGMALAQNDSRILMDGLMMRNDSVITILMMGIFISMFMTMIPALVKTLFNIQISDKFYQTAKNNINIMWNSAKKWYEAIKK
ncbi:hypothetical protein HDR61_01385 [bacterium]|nr:hypothetical protein [bacterium]